MSVTSLLVTQDGMPQPSPELERRLRDANPRLGIRFYPALKQWGITCQWAERDARREMAQKGEIGGDATFDIVCFLPTDCGVDEAVAYMLPRMAAHPTKDVRAMMLALAAHNDAQSELNAAPVFDELKNQVEVLVANRRSPTVFMNDTEARTTRVSDLARASHEGRDR